jgi:hypothetical protein
MRVNHVRPDIAALADAIEVPGIGHLAVNAFVLRAAQPVVVDSGLGLPDRGLLDALRTVIDPADVEWIWLTHPDRDHTGSLFELLELAPRARVVTSFLGVGIMSSAQPLPMDRVFLLNPGQTLDVGDRILTAFRPPLFDSPATVGFHDDCSGAIFTSDCFGAPLADAELALAADVAETPAEELRGRQLLWATVDSPWVHDVDAARFERSIERLRRMCPSVILSTHLPPAGPTADLLAMLERAPAAAPFLGPDQAQLEQMMAGALAQAGDDRDR